jgi:hypothetical protein
MTAETPLKCPVCEARFRRERRCPRCGADLFPLMLLAAKSFLLRQAGREALRAGDARGAHELARQAQALCDTPRGRRLFTFTRWVRHVLQRLPLPPAR